MDLEESSTNITSVGCFRGFTPPESLVECLENLGNESKGPTSSPQENSGVVTPNANSLLSNFYNSERNPCPASDTALTDVSNHEFEDYQNNGYPGIPSSSPTKHQNGEQVPTTSQEQNDDVDESAGIPSSSPPVSSPVTSGYCRSSSPIPLSSPPRASSLTPPSSPERYPDSVADIRSADLDSSEFLASFNPISIASRGTVQEQVPSATGTDVIVANDIKGEEGHPIISELLPPKGQTTTTTSKDAASGTTGDEALHRKKYQHLIPGPKRATFAAQQVQHKKLSKPFRPPMVVQAQVNNNIGRMSVPTMSETPAMPDKGNTHTLMPPAHDKIKDRMAKAAGQFKSPLSKSCREEAVGPLVRPTPTIQALERKLQILKRANKVRENSEEDTLRKLIEKWTEAGREIAWEVWDLVKNNVHGEQQGAGKKRNFEESWAWQDAGDSKRPKVEEEERNWGWDIVPVREREDDGVRRTLGRMLLELGIAPETFGWNEEEESFTVE